jgi:hypothetical protein
VPGPPRLGCASRGDFHVVRFSLQREKITLGRDLNVDNFAHDIAFTEN